jgi:hypothetical protein
MSYREALAHVIELTAMLLPVLLGASLIYGAITDETIKYGRSFVALVGLCFAVFGMAGCVWLITGWLK